MTFRPTISQLETIAELSHARAPVADIAREPHITAHDFIEWRQAMMAAASDEAARLRRQEPVPLREPPERPAQMTAARLFEMPAPGS